MNRGRNSNRNNGQMDLYGNSRDPFQQMHQIMHSFGGMGGFGGGFGSGLFGRDNFMSDPFEDMMEFSKAHKNLHSSNNGGSYVCQTYVSSSTRDKDGKIKQESYFENSAGQNKNGNTISQKQQAYKNNDGVRRVAEERMLNDKGRKMVKQKRGNQDQQLTNHYYNMEEDELDSFDRNWQGINHETRFLENAARAMQSLPYSQQRQLQPQLGYEPRQQQRESRRLPQEPRQQYRQLPEQRRGASRGSHASSTRNSYKSGYRGY